MGKVTGLKKEPMKNQYERWTIGSEYGTVHPDDDSIVLFEGDPDCTYDIHKDFVEIFKLINDFFCAFENSIEVKKLAKIFCEIPGISGDAYDEYSRLENVPTLISAACIGGHEYWGGQGPVSGYNYKITLPKNEIKASLENLWSLARRLQTLVPSELRKQKAGISNVEFGKQRLNSKV